MRRGIGIFGSLVAIGAALTLVWVRSRGPHPIDRSDSDGERVSDTADARPPSELAVGPAHRPTNEAPVPEVRRADRASRIVGRILDAEGRPVAGAVVRLVHAGPTDPSATTDEDGNFTLDAPAGSATTVVVTRNGFADAQVAIASLAAGARVAFAKPWVIEGTVRERGTDTPIVAIPVMAKPSSSPESNHPSIGVWREDGTFTVTLPGPGSYVLDVGAKYLSGIPTMTDAFMPTRIEAVAAGTTTLQVTLERGRGIEGEIVDDTGQRVARLLSIDAVGRTPAGDPDYTTRKIVHSTDGTLNVPGLRPGRYDLWIQPDGKADEVGGAQVSSTVVRDIAAGTQGLVVRLVRGFILIGRLQDEAGAAVTGKGYVYAYPAGEMAKSHPAYGQVIGDGTFRVGPLDDGLRYDLLATGFAGHQEGKSLGVAPRDAGGAVIVLPLGHRISGRVETEDGKRVPAGVPIGVIAEGSDLSKVGARNFAYTTSEGTFVVDGLLDLPFTVEAGGGVSGYLGVIVRGVKAGSTEVVLKVSTGAELSGTLVDEKGEPVATTSLMADDGARIAAMRPYAQVGADGRFRFRGLKPGPVRLLARIGVEMLPAGEVVAPSEQVMAKLSRE